MRTYILNEVDFVGVDDLLDRHEREKAVRLTSSARNSDNNESLGRHYERRGNDPHHPLRMRNSPRQGPLMTSPSMVSPSRQEPTAIASAPSSFYCPLTMGLMKDPVQDREGENKKRQCFMY